jgi:hypothetical protein
VQIEVSDRVLPKLRCKNERVCGIGAGKRVTGPNQHRCSGASNNNVIAYAAVENRSMAVRAIDRDACSSAEIGLVLLGIHERQRRRVGAGRNLRRKFGIVGWCLGAMLGRKEAMVGAVTVTERPPKYLSFIVDAARGEADAIGRIDRRVSAVVVEKPVLLAGIVQISPDNFSFVIDVVDGSIASPGEVDNRVGITAVDEALFGAAATLLESPGNFSLGIDSRDNRRKASWGIDRRNGPVVVQEEAV